MAKKNTKFFLWFIVTTLVLFGGARLYYRLTDDFRLANITYKMPHHQEWEIKQPSAEDQKKIDSILDQKFHYIGKGAQSYAFVSDDGEYVLKFFKFKHLRPNWIVNSLPNIPPFSQYRDQLSIRKHRKLYGVFTGYHLGYTEDRDKTALLYIHLNTGNELKRSVTVVDKIGFEHSINLDHVPFVLQEKGATFGHVMDNLLSKQDLATAQIRIRQMFDLYLHEFQKGLFDKDHGLMHNTGFVADRPFHLDVGKLTKDESMKSPQNYEPDLEFLAWKIETWIKNHYPQYYEQLTGYISAQLTEIFGRPFDFKTNTKPVIIKHR